MKTKPAKPFNRLPLLDRIRLADKWAQETPHEVGRQIKRKMEQKNEH